MNLNPSFVNKELTIGTVTIKKGQAWWYDPKGFHNYIVDWIHVGPFRYIKTDYNDEWETVAHWSKNHSPRRWGSDKNCEYRYLNRQEGERKIPRVTLLNILAALVAVHETIWGIIRMVVLTVLGAGFIASLVHLLISLIKRMV